jgi:hypothetical protein
MTTVARIISQASLAALLASLTIAACSSDNDPATKPAATGGTKGTSTSTGGSTHHDGGTADAANPDAGE